jgi:hypothetical protein
MAYRSTYAEPLLPDPSRLEVEIALAKLKHYTWLGSDQITASLIQVGGEILVEGVHYGTNLQKG